MTGNVLPFSVTYLSCSFKSYSDFRPLGEAMPSFGVDVDFRLELLQEGPSPPPVDCLDKDGSTRG